MYAVALAAVLPTAGRAQQVPLDHPRVRATLDALRADNAWTLDQQVSLCEIPAPPFGEAARGAEFKRRLEALGLSAVRIDSVGNVIAERAGRAGTGRRTRVVLSAHLDTVFPESTDVRVTREGTVLRGPGIGDDCRGLAVVLAVVRALQQAGLETQGDIVFVGTVGEEGPGNLRGVRHLFDRQSAGRVDYFISIDGTGLGLTSRAVGSHRYRVTYRGPGGHSYGAFGMPNPIHALGRAIAHMADIQVPAQPKTTFNVGVIAGGTSVNSISATGVMDVDLRSESAEALDSLDARFRRAVAAALNEEHARWPGSDVRLTATIEATGVRPAGAQPDSVRIVRVAQSAAQALGFGGPTQASSTDANWPMSLGVPAITMDGGGDGRGAHSLSESYDDGLRGYLGPQWAVLVAVLLAGVR